MKKVLLAVCCILVHTGLYAASLAEFQSDWAIANYRLSGEAQIARFEQLDAKMAETMVATPKDPNLLIWQGIIKSTFAGKVSGFKALGLVKAARKSLEKAIAIEDHALNGSAYTSLGALYYQVPGWPIAFGSDKKARINLEKALAINPDGIDSNYFYADFLYQNGELAAAKTALVKAMSAPDRPGRDLADTGRREEIKILMAKIEAK